MPRGRYITDDGYVRILAPKHHRADKYGFVLEHIYVMEEKLGREITFEDGHIHHIDQNKSNNHPDNLMLLSPSDHAKIHAQLRKEGVVVTDKPKPKIPNRKTKRHKTVRKSKRKKIETVVKDVVWDRKNKRWEKVYEFIQIAK